MLWKVSLFSLLDLSAFFDPLIPLAHLEELVLLVRTVQLQ